MEHIAMLDRWLHIVAGVMWIGLLYFFNFVQVPALAAANAEANSGGPGPAAITKYVAPRALFWFRYAALVTWLSGMAYLSIWPDYSVVNVFSFGYAAPLPPDVPHIRLTNIGFGAWLGTIMAFNVWFLIWPNQKKILGMVPADDATKAKARRVAFLASRTNTMLSIPMLMFMQSGTHGLPF
jgi:uncharacterized membrane protein